MVVLTAQAGVHGEESWVDRDNFPQAYSILTSDRLLFPENIADWPLRIDTTHQLFVDDFLIGGIAGLSRSFHQPAKHTDNPLMPGWAVAVLRDPRGGRLRMWNGRRHFVSDDGVRWEDDGPIDLPGPGGIRGLMYNPHAPRREGRYKAVIERRVEMEGGNPISFFAAHSRDGIHWEYRPPVPILVQRLNNMLPAAFRPMGVGRPDQFAWQNPSRVQSSGAGDTSTFRYDPVLRRYIYDGKFKTYLPEAMFAALGIVHEAHKPIQRLRAYSESTDLVHWTPPRMLLYPDRLDPPDRQVYGHVGFVYESMWLGVMRSMQIAPEGWKQVTLQLTHSRDGRHWSRPADRAPFIPLGPPEGWEPDYSGPALTAPILQGEQLLFYYFGSRHFTRDQIPPEQFKPFVGLATLRRDGFASLDAAETPGCVTTRPLSFPGRRLWVNAAVEPGGWVKAALLSGDKTPLAGYSLDEAVPLEDNTTRGALVWRGNDRTPRAEKTHVRIQFMLSKARLFSFWLE